MYKNLGRTIRKIAIAIDEERLTPEDVALLRERPKKLMVMIKNNVDQRKNAFKDFNDRDKRIMLAFVVYERQNAALTPEGNPNEEDAAKILHSRVYEMTGNKKQDKKTKEELEDDLKEQLQKIGVELKKE